MDSREGESEAPPNASQPIYLFTKIDEKALLPEIHRRVVEVGENELGKAVRNAGHEWQAVSPTPAIHNQIFAASRFPFKIGDLQPPQLLSSPQSLE